jgi:hypothetical protein
MEAVVTSKFTIGDKVCKSRGYKFNGIVIAIFKNFQGQVRVCVELVSNGNGNGSIHIFSENQLENENPPCSLSSIWITNYAKW